MNLSELKKAGHWPTLLSAFLYFGVSLMIWMLLRPLGVQIGESLGLSPQQKRLMVAIPILAGAFLRIVLGGVVEPAQPDLLAEGRRSDLAAEFNLHAASREHARATRGYDGRRVGKRQEPIRIVRDREEG